MAVAIEFVNVIIRKAAVERSFPGGLDGFACQDLPNLTEDEHLLRVGFMSGSEAFRFTSKLEAAGLCHINSGAASDIAVIWGGSDVPPWLSIGYVNGYSACWASDHPVGELAWPENGFALRCPRAVYHALPGIVRQCGAQINDTTSLPERGCLANLHCVRGAAEMWIHVAGGPNDDSPVGLWGQRQLVRRHQFRDDVALIHDLETALTQAGAT